MCYPSSRRASFTCHPSPCNCTSFWDLAKDIVRFRFLVCTVSRSWRAVNLKSPLNEYHFRSRSIVPPHSGNQTSPSETCRGAFCLFVARREALDMCTYDESMTDFRSSAIIYRLFIVECRIAQHWLPESEAPVSVL